MSRVAQGGHSLLNLWDEAWSPFVRQWYAGCGREIVVVVASWPDLGGDWRQQAAARDQLGRCLGEILGSLGPVARLWASAVVALTEDQIEDPEELVWQLKGSIPAACAPSALTVGTGSYPDESLDDALLATVAAMRGQPLPLYVMSQPRLFALRSRRARNVYATVGSRRSGLPPMGGQGEESI